MKKKKKYNIKLVKKYLVLLLLPLIYLIYITISFAYIPQNLKGKRVEITRGMSYIKVYEKLGIKFNAIDKIYSRISKKTLKEGSFRFDKNISKRELINTLNKPQGRIKLTIPEGFTQDQVLERIEALGLANKSEMIAALNSIDFPYFHEKDNYDGYLFPETYFVSSNMSAKEIAKLILDEFMKNFPESDYPDKKKFYEDIKLASIVEFEIGFNEIESENVAGVFKNRLQKGMRLQSDATLKYILKRKVLKKDLQENMSVYNTYRHKGLPPTPICNPNKKTIKATINAPVSKYLYFFMSGDKTYYSMTHEEHLKKRNEVK